MKFPEIAPIMAGEYPQQAAQDTHAVESPVNQEVLATTACCGAIEPEQAARVSLSDFEIRSRISPRKNAIRKISLTGSIPVGRTLSSVAGEELEQTTMKLGGHALVQDAKQNGANCDTGGQRIGNNGYFHAPIVLSSVSTGVRAMNEEPFGPVALISQSGAFGEALQEDNRLPVGSASSCFSQDDQKIHRIASRIKAGTPLGDVPDNGSGLEGGTEGVEPCLATMLITSHNSSAMVRVSS